jgi:hypothetical protein
MPAAWPARPIHAAAYRGTVRGQPPDHRAERSSVHLEAPIDRDLPGESRTPFITGIFRKKTSFARLTGGLQAHAALLK